MLVAREEAGHVLDLSYGTHFFLDLVESRIIYLPLYPDDLQAALNHNFFHNAANVLISLFPQTGRLEQCIKVIDVPAAARQ